MADKIVLISDDADFFDYIRLKLELRKSDELFMYGFEEIPERLHLLRNSLLIINGETSHDQTLQLLKIVKAIPSIVIVYNEEVAFKKKCYQLGVFDFIPLLTSDAEFRARLLPALSILSILKRNEQYREILVNKGMLSENNEVFIDYESILDGELKRIRKESVRAVFGAIAPNEKSKFLLNQNTIETIILSNIRKNDILMNYAPNKYFLLIFNSDLKSAEKLWNKIRGNFSQGIYAGFSMITNQSRQQLINEVLNKLHQSMSYNVSTINTKNINNLNDLNSTTVSNFKFYRKEFGKKFEQLVTPVFYRINQKYANNIMGTVMEQSVDKGSGTFTIKGRHFISSFRLTSPGFSKINIDITFQKDCAEINAKRISLDINELESGFLEDLLEQFVSEVKNSAAIF